MCTFHDLMLTLLPIQDQDQGHWWKNCCEWNVYTPWRNDDLGANRRSRPRSLVKCLLWMECVHLLTYWWPCFQSKIKTKVIGEMFVVNGMCTFRDLMMTLLPIQEWNVYIPWPLWWPCCQSKIKTKVIGKIIVVNGMCTFHDILMTLLPIEDQDQGHWWNNCYEWNVYIPWPDDDLAANRRSRPRSSVK